MNTRVNSVSFLNIQPKQSPNFKSNARFYRLPNGAGMETFTYFFREDLQWKNFIPFIKDHFQNLPKVRIINAACSDGTEAFSLIIALRELLKGENYDKFLPIKAYDIDDEVLRAANSGYILVNPDDVYEIKRYTKKMDKYLEKDNEDILKISQNGMCELIDGNVFLAQSTYKVNKRLRKQVDFDYGDIFNVLENYVDNGDTILFFRNTLGHFDENKINDFIKLAANKLKAGSLLIIGDFDTNSVFLLENKITTAGFTQVMKNVYEKDSEIKFLIKRIKKAVNDKCCKAIDLINDLLYADNKS